MWHDPGNESGGRLSPSELDAMFADVFSQGNSEEASMHVVQQTRCVSRTSTQSSNFLDAVVAARTKMEAAADEATLALSRETQAAKKEEAPRNGAEVSARSMGRQAQTALEAAERMDSSVARIAAKINKLKSVSVETGDAEADAHMECDTCEFMMLLRRRGMHSPGPHRSKGLTEV